MIWFQPCRAIRIICLWSKAAGLGERYIASSNCGLGNTSHTAVPSAGSLHCGVIQGIRTVISTNSQPTAAVKAEGAQNNETWVYYPDDTPARSFYRGDSRAALAPFLAHKELGDTYKWMLYGDDDTQFFLDGALRLAKDFDPDLPWFITGNAALASPNCMPSCRQLYSAL